MFEKQSATGIINVSVRLTGRFSKTLKIKVKELKKGFLKIKNKLVTRVRFVPVYAANGTQFYLVSLATFLALFYWRPMLCVYIYQGRRLRFSAIKLCVTQ